MIDIYQISKKILYETIEGEVIAMDMQSGSYFSLRNSAASIWSLLIHPISIDQIVTQITNCYGIEREVAALDLQPFLIHLQEEQLIDLLTVQHPAAISSVLPPDIDSYSAPVLEVFTDVQDLLTIDLIHDVDEMGWPQPKQMVA